MSYPTNPLISKMPYTGYQDNETAKALCAGVDADYFKVATTLEGMPSQLDPLTANSSYLEYLAYLVGLSDGYWDNAWSEQVKRDSIKNAYLLANTKGTQAAILLALSIQQVTYSLWLQPPLVLPFTMPGTFQGANLRFFIRLGLRYSRTSREWLEAVRALKNYKPAVVDGRVVYEGFKLGYSKLGEPLFK
jgi:phage tail P2-like protein